ncbi:hypothetical protein SCA6_015498, partial [Theobroma cacao]
HCLVPQSRLSLLPNRQPPEMGGEFLLKIWVNALKDFHYDVEDLLDEYSIETPQCRWSTECQESTAEVLQPTANTIFPPYFP